MNKYVLTEIEAKDFNPADHPRDRNGRFIRKGVSVNVPKLGVNGSSGAAKVVGTRSRGRIEVQDDAGTIHVVKANQVEVAKVQPGAPKRQRSGVPMRPETRHRRNEKNNELYSRAENSHSDVSDSTASDKAYAEHTKLIERTVGAAFKAGEATDKKYTLDEGGRVWDPERAKIHKEIVDELYLHAAKVPTDGKALIAGGLGGAGKSTVLTGGMHVGNDDYFTINPDDIKEAMAERDMVPRLPGLSPMEASPLIHEESSHIANMLAQRAYADRRNVIWDITMSSQGSVEKRIADMRAKGYGTIDAVFVDIPVETSVERALARHRRGMEEYDAGGAGFGGRYVPPALIRRNASSKASSANREAFDALRASFDNWQLFDNSGSAPKKVSAGGKLSALEFRRQGRQYVAQLPGGAPGDLQVFAPNRNGSGDLTWTLSMAAANQVRGEGGDAPVGASA